jgi:hypothetical protein
VVSPPLKNISQLRLLFPIYGNIKFMFQNNNQTKLIKLSTGFTLSDSIPDYWFLPDLCADPVNPHVLKSRSVHPRYGWEGHAGRSPTPIGRSCIPLQLEFHMNWNSIIIP